METWILWLAQGFGIGRIPFAPGTFGSLLGLVLSFLLLLPCSPWFYLSGMVISTVSSVWICGQAEKILGLKDPGSVVWDEIIALPICFLGWILWEWHRQGRWPEARYFLQTPQIITVAGVFIAFRLFDILKPWPVKQIQDLPGGWGITADDVFAAFYVNILLYAVLLFKPYS